MVQFTNTYKPLQILALCCSHLASLQIQIFKLALQQRNLSVSICSHSSCLRSLLSQPVKFASSFFWDRLLVCRPPGPAALLVRANPHARDVDYLHTRAWTEAHDSKAWIQPIFTKRRVKLLVPRRRPGGRTSRLAGKPSGVGPINEPVRVFLALLPPST